MNISLDQRVVHQHHYRSLFIAFVAVLAFGILVALAAFLPGAEDMSDAAPAVETAERGETARTIDGATDQGAGMAAAMLLVAALTGGGIGMALWLGRRLDLEW